jgi:hypothetical protein
MKKLCAIFILALFVGLVQISQAQIHAGGFIGFKSYGLKAAGSATQNGQRSTTPIADGGGTVFEFGGFGGYTPLSMGVYNLDVQLTASYSSIGFFERGYNSVYGAGKYAADGISGGTTSVMEFDILGLNRLSFPALNIIEPYAGVGMSFNLYSTGDLTVPNGSIKGNSQFKIGLVIAYGAILHVTPVITPYLQLKHMIPFGSETQLTNDVSYTAVVNDVPGYFALTAGVRFSL